MGKIYVESSGKHVYDGITFDYLTLSATNVKYVNCTFIKCTMIDFTLCDFLGCRFESCIESEKSYTQCEFKNNYFKNRNIPGTTYKVLDQNTPTNVPKIAQLYPQDLQDSEIGVIGPEVNSILSRIFKDNGPTQA